MWFTFHYELIITCGKLITKRGQKKFTFHYELIITFAFICLTVYNILIYISLWTNYNRNKRQRCIIYLEIYISLWTNYNEIASKLYIDNLTFTFHYELIITKSRKWRAWCVCKIYISLWTNYNNSVTSIGEEAFRFTFHYELIITITILNFY